MFNARDEFNFTKIYTLIMKTVAIILLGDYYKDARSINLSNTIIEKGYSFAIISSSPRKYQKKLNLY